MNSNNRVGLNNPQLFHCSYIGAYLKGNVVQKAWKQSDYSNQRDLSILARHLLTHEVELGNYNYIIF